MKLHKSGAAAVVKPGRGADFWLAVAWAVFTPIAFAVRLTNVLAFVSFISLYAIVVGHWSAYQAHRAPIDVVEAVVADPRIPTGS